MEQQLDNRVPFQGNKGHIVAQALFRKENGRENYFRVSLIVAASE